MTHYRLFILLAALLIAALGCSLSSGGDNPTPLPTQTAAAFLPTATLAPLPTPLPTVTQAPTALPLPTSAPCIPNTTWPLLAVQSGDTLFAIAQRTGSTVAQLTAANCLANANSIQAGQLLRVPMLPPVTVTPAPTQTSPVTCQYAWFFSFEPGKFDTRRACPNPAQVVSASGQDFEGGRVLRYDALPGSTDTRGTIYVIYNDGTWESFIDPWAAGMPESDPSIVPPAGRYPPLRGIGMVWRDNPQVRQKLGWAYEPAAPFTGRFQEPTGFAGIWADRDPYVYVDHGKWGVVLRLTSSVLSANTFEIAGRY